MLHSTAATAAQSQPQPQSEHPLKNTWTFWFIQRSSNSKHIQAENYESYLKRVIDVESVEQLLAVYRYTKRGTDLPSFCDLHLFRSPVRPVWEDEANANGGKLAIRLKKGLCARLWELLMVTVVGEKYEILRGVCGIILSTRYQEDIIAVWIKSGDDTEMLREFLRKTLCLPSNTVIEYKAHKASLKAATSHPSGEN